MRPKEFSCLDRAKRLDQLINETFDIIVIGGGVTGAGIALDATTRGMRTLLVEKADFGSGTSSKSTKLIHGGLRYLKQFEIGLVRETGTERAVVHKLAPHLVHPERMLLPIVENGSFGKWSASIAISVYDYLAGVEPKDRKIGLSNEELMEAEPLLKREKIKGGVNYSEYRTDDARLTFSLVQAAVRHGATALNYCELKDFIYADGKLKALRCQDHITDREVELKGTYVVSSTGPWVDLIRRRDGSLGGKSLHLTKGVHIVLPKAKLPIKQAVYFDAFDGRMIFAIPRGKVTYVGTSDTTYKGDLDRVVCTREDAIYLLNATNNYFNVPNLNLNDINSSWAGLRPLIHEDGKSPTELSRKDEIFESSSGLISIAGGKLTGYRKMAERIVNLIAKKDERFVGKSKTASLSLHDPAFSSYDEVLQEISDLNPLCEKLGLNEHTASYLVSTYGKYGRKFIERLDQHDSESIDTSLLMLELDHALKHESVYRAQDFFNRRTGRTYFDIESVQSSNARVIDTLAKHYGWTEEVKNEELLRSQAEIDDCTAFASVDMEAAVK